MVDTFFKLSRPDRCRAATFGRAFGYAGTKTGVPEAGGTLEHGSARKSSGAIRCRPYGSGPVENHRGFPINPCEKIINTPDNFGVTGDCVEALSRGWRGFAEKDLRVRIVMIGPAGLARPPGIWPLTERQATWCGEGGRRVA